MDEIRQILDLEAYPLDRREQCGDLVRECQRNLEQSGMFSLAGFVRPDAIRHAAEELRPLVRNRSFHHIRAHNIFFDDHVAGVPVDHPALTEVVSSNHTVCGDQFPGGVINRIYEWPPLTDFLARTMNKPQLFTMEDPLARVNVMSYQDGEGLGWHYDRSEFTTTLLIQEPIAGGEFEYRLDLRSENDPNLDGVARLMRGNDPDVQRVRLTAGTLNVFRGKNSPHQVVPTSGERDRLVAVFSFYERPGVIFSREERVGFYGREQ